MTQGFMGGGKGGGRGGAYAYEVRGGGGLQPPRIFQVAIFGGKQVIYIYIFFCFPSACYVYYSNIVVIEELFCTEKSARVLPPPPPPPLSEFFLGLARRRKYSGKRQPPNKVGPVRPWGGAIIIFAPAPNPLANHFLVHVGSRSTNEELISKRG